MAAITRVSRETRLLVITALAAVAVLWLLARIRFPDREVTANPVPPLLTQIAPLPRFENLAAEVSAARMRIDAPLMAIPVDGGREAMAIRPGLAVAWLDPAVDDLPAGDAELIALDPQTGLGLVRTSITDVKAPALWEAQDLEQPRYLLVSDTSGDDVLFRPVFVGALMPIDVTGWPAAIWRMPAHTDVHAGSFAFTTAGEFAGLVVPHGRSFALVPGDVLVKGAAWVDAADPAP